MSPKIAVVAARDSMRFAPLVTNSPTIISRFRLLPGTVLPYLPSYLLSCLFSVLLLSASAQALEAIPDTENYPIPADLNGVHFYLITVDVGDMVYDNFGHTALRVYDENTGTDTVYNWGVFDVSGGVVKFSYDFFKGIMQYELATHSPAQEFATYRYQQRSVWQDRINLTNPQKERLYRRLLWNVQEENIVYDYQYFSDNCTTRVRDYLDEALSGKIFQSFTAVTQRSFRDIVQAHYESVSLIGFSLDVLMNSNIDRPVSEWEEMFLPLSLRARLSQMQSDVADASGRLPLLSESQVIMEFPAPRKEVDAYRIAAFILLIPVTLLFLFLKRIPMSFYATHSRLGLKLPGISFRVLGILGLLTALFSGVYGALMLGSWFVSDHLDLHHNMNLLLFWPTDLLGLMVALRWLIACKPWPMTHNSKPFINYYFFAHVLGMLAYAAVALLGLSAQSISSIAFYVLPGFFLYTILIWMVGFEAAKPRNTFF